MDYKSIIESRYNRENWQRLLFDIFGNRVEFWSDSQSVPVDANMAKSACYMGKITLPDNYVIAIYEVALSESVVIERNRAGIRNLLCSSWRSMGCAGAFMFCYRDSEAVLRFSYVSESFAFAEDGTMVKEKTDTKRFTYLLGEGHRSRTAIKQFEDLKKSALDLKAITKAFSVEALSDQFFKEYKKQYENIIALITGKRMVKVANKWEEQPDELIPTQDKATFGAAIMQEFSQFANPEKAVRDYVKKLMGRLVFIQFLQKKGWMGCSVGDAWNDGDKEFIQNLFAKSAYKDTFVDDVLEPLFNDINTRRQGDICSSSAIGLNIKVPYLNGGLFEKDDYDQTAFPLPAKYMKDMLDFFASYNFTIDENDPDDAEIGVDPEMLGRIFENLLEDNKDKGAFYTPKEIVQYMCRESLIAYLQTDIEDNDVKESIRQFVTTHDVSVLAAGYEETIDQKLKDVKICDPAIGSGAFPMGLLRELYACRKSIEGIDDDTAVSIKTHIIQNNIYGVDIEKGAVDIARLRFWLALIVDEKNPHALPNMDFKIMQGNSLLEEYKGVNLSGLGKGNILGTKSLSKKKGSDFSQQTSLAIDCETSIDNITKDLKTYFSTSDHAQKVVMLEAINRNVHDFIRHAVNERADIMEELDSIKLENDQFFLWHTWFKDVFDNGGFDIVIGNPPYIRQEKLGTDYKTLLTHIYPNVGNGTADILVYFFGIGIKNLKNKGVLAFITSNKFLKTRYGKELRNTLSNETNVKLFIDFFELPVFHNAATDAGITILTKNFSLCETKYFPVKSLENLDLSKLTSGTFLKTIKTESEWQFIDSREDELIEKIHKDTISLKEFCNDRIYRGITTGMNQAFVIKDKEIANKLLNSESACMLKPYVLPTDIHKWKIDSIDKYIVATYPACKIEIENYPTLKQYLLSFGKEKLEQTGKKYCFNGETIQARKKTNNKWYETQDSIAYWREFDEPKIIYIHTAKNHQFYMDYQGYHINNSCYLIACDSKFLFCFLNSKLFNWYKRKKFVAYGDGDEEGRCKLDYNKMITIPIKNNVDETSFINIVQKARERQSVDSNVNLDDIDNEIDLMIYKLYDLSPDEIKIIEGETKNDLTEK